ncbi:MAG: NusG domain II-containing protein [Lachnospiraceae bacterium]|nr:NusG domain II-containing protein [Lachnospiraceae bacterium]
MKTGKNDFILIGIILFLALGIFAVYKLTAGAGDGGTVLISVDGREYARFPLSQEGIYLIRKGEDIRKLDSEDIPSDITDKGYNILKVSGESATMIKAGCPDLLCVHQADIAHTGDQIVCLPNKVVVEIVNGKTGKVDIVTN